MTRDGRGEESPRARMRAGIRASVLAWVPGVSGRAGPWGLLVLLVSAALAPVALPAWGLGAAAAPIWTYLGGLSGNFLAELVAGLVARKRREGQLTEENVREALAAELVGRLESGDGAPALRREVAELLHAISGVEVAIGAAVEAGAEEVQQELVRVFSDLGSSFDEFRWMVDELRVTVTLIHEQLTVQRVEQRRQTELLQRTLFAVTLLGAQTAGRDTALGGSRLASSEDSDPGDPDGFTSTRPTPDSASTGSWQQVDNGLGSDCPYQGLACFEPEDADRFFGRSRLTAALLTRLAERSSGPAMLAVVGPSGSGKSSLLRAGLVPWLAHGRLGIAGSHAWPWLVLTPGPHPAAELAVRVASLAGVSAGSARRDILADPSRFPLLVRQAVLAETGKLRGVGATPRSDQVDDRDPPSGQPRPRLVLVVDQFEEVFTHCHDEEERQGFIAALHLAASGVDEEPPALVVLGIRADFYGRCAAYSELVPPLQDNLTVGPMSARELREVIEEPARAAALPVEPGFVEVLLADLGVGPDPVADAVHPLATGTAETTTTGSYEAGKLPLLSHALYMSWQRRQGPSMTVASYRAVGGIQGAIAETAEEVYQDLAPAEREELRRVMLHLTAVGDGVADTRRRVQRVDLFGQHPDQHDARAEAVVARLVSRRLVTVHEDTVEITHEALLTAWPRLRAWIDADRAGLLISQRVNDAGEAWVREQREPANLYGGSRLAAAREQAEASRYRHLTSAGYEFLQASIAKEQASIVREAAEQARNRRRTRRFQILAAALTVLLVAVIGVTYYAFGQQAAADEQRQMAVSRKVATQAALLRPTQPAQSMLLAAAAWRIAPTVEARSALLEAQVQHFAGQLTGHTDYVITAAIDPSGRRVVTASKDSTVRLWDLRSRTELATFRGHTGQVNAAVFDPTKDNVVVSVGRDDTIRWWDVDTREQIAMVAANQRGVNSPER